MYMLYAQYSEQTPEHIDSRFHVENDFMSSNIHCNITFIHGSPPNHVNDVKRGNWADVNCVVFVVI